MLASWRTKSAKSYDSLFQKWIGWCQEWGSDPVSGPVSEVVNFLADLFEKGYQYRSLNAYRSAISSTHDKVDEASVGQHPLVTRLLAGAFNSRPPQPRYTTTWDVHAVLSYLKGQGENKTLPLKDLTLKTVMLLALTRPSRSADLRLLNVDLCRQSPEGVTFSPAGLTKQARPSNPHQEFVFSKFAPDPSICPVVTVNQYMERMEILHHPEGGQRASQLFISWIKPHQPVTSSSIAQWLKTTLERAGIDVSIF